MGDEPIITCTGKGIARTGGTGTGHKDGKPVHYLQKGAKLGPGNIGIWDNTARDTKAIFAFACVGFFFHHLKGSSIHGATIGTTYTHPHKTRTLQLYTPQHHYRRGSIGRGAFLGPPLCVSLFLRYYYFFPVSASIYVIMGERVDGFVVRLFWFCI
jgi:hypothetical protein